MAMLLHVLATSEAVTGFFKKNCKRMKIKLISVRCSCLVRHFD